ncbi:MAG: hypothetical protein ACK5JH_02915 [Anaerocolumna sp.]
MNNKVFSIATDHKPQDGMIISTDPRIGNKSLIHFFTLRKNTDISAKTYDWI